MYLGIERIKTVMKNFNRKKWLKKVMIFSVDMTEQNKKEHK